MCWSTPLRNWNQGYTIYGIAIGGKGYWELFKFFQPTSLRSTPQSNFGLHITYFMDKRELCKLGSGSFLLARLDQDENEDFYPAYVIGIDKAMENICLVRTPRTEKEVILPLKADLFHALDVKELADATRSKLVEKAHLCKVRGNINVEFLADHRSTPVKKSKHSPNPKERLSSSKRAPMKTEIAGAADKVVVSSVLEKSFGQAPPNEFSRMGNLRKNSLLANEREHLDVLSSLEEQLLGEQAAEVGCQAESMTELANDSDTIVATAPEGSPEQRQNRFYKTLARHLSDLEPFIDSMLACVIAQYSEPGSDESPPLDNETIQLQQSPRLFNCKLRDYQLEGVSLYCLMLKSETV